MTRTFFRLLAACFVSVALISAQEPDYTLKVDVPFVSVDVTVQDATGKAVNDLPKEAFVLYENGVRQDITHFLPVSTPYNVVLLFDRSGSTQDKWLLMQRAVAGFIASLRPQDRIAIATFDYSVQVQLPWTSDRTKALLVLPQLVQPNRVGGTDFYGSVDQTLRREFKKVTGRRALIVLTDGRDTSLYKDAVNRRRVLEPKQDHPYQTALKSARSQRVPIYFIAFNTDKNFEPNMIGGDEYRSLRLIFPNSPIADRYLVGVRNRMEELADVSGGHVLFPQRLEDIVPLYQSIGSELGTSYTLGYVSSSAATESSFRKIEVHAQDTRLRLRQSRNGYSAK
ncbi:MAG TPA: VWA domain-containing protein [Pyrinomonadaceae bacterium]|nr:VWA domain-containing protein [Pyrinomonadaceae bacterium]